MSGDRPAASAVALTVGLAVAGLVVGLWRPWAPSLPTPTTDLTSFTAEIEAAVAAYRDPRVVAALVARVVAVAVPLLVVVSTPGRALLTAVAGGSSGRPLVRAAAVGVMVSVAVWLATLPVGVWAGIVHDGRWGIRRASAGLWWRDRVLSQLLTAAVTGLVAAGFLLLVRRRPRDWPWLGTCLLTGVITVAAVVWPLVVSPLFLPTRPLEPGPVRDAVVAVLERADMADARIEVAEASTRTTKINALVTGLGPSRRVLLHDTLLARPIDEIEVVVAHELAHRQHRDIARGVLVSVPGILLGALALRRVVTSGRLQRLVGAVDITDPRMVAVALAAVALLQAVADPVVLWYSRRVEATADHASLVLSRDPAAVIGIQRTFVVADLSRPDPPAWQVALLSSHPPTGSRIRHAVAFAEEEGIPLPTLEDYERREAATERPWLSPP